MFDQNPGQSLFDGSTEVIPFFIAERWREATEAIGFSNVMNRAVDLSYEQYQALHEGKRPQGLDYIPQNEFIVDHVGTAVERRFSDLGIEYYRYVG